MDEQKYYYKFYYDDEGYIIGFTTEASESDYEFYGLLENYPGVLDSLGHKGGWYKYQNNTFIEDLIRKSEIIDKASHTPTWQETVEAQVTYTAMMTDTLINAEV